ncbi:MAG: isocitrate lyase/phosphoenolpyruvate mutase family protein [Actinomycetota bacterium]|jgi:methylisocitrate lyase|nr:isocitrate lyase/phosphoenolpyruvate mutase family protein [Actinomycetota bacterium]|tara:strand:+ start:686 stop:1558 length:873 start_codon:yes stop_codon:yes gene_type:complete
MNDARSRLREATLGDETIFAPLILDPLAGLLAQEFGFKAGYLSGGALGFQYAVSEALLTTTEIADVARRITSRCELPLIVDGGVGFGDPVHVVRAVWEFERAGAAAVEFEDQIAPKRVHHHIGVEHLISTDDMCAKVTAAAEARSDENFLIIARTGAMRHEGVESGIARLNSYVDAGADIAMAFCRDQDLQKVASNISAPMATITSLDHHSPQEWKDYGWSLIIDAFTSQALSLTVTRDAYRNFTENGSTGTNIDGMKLHRELVETTGLSELLDLERRTTETAEYEKGTR